MYTWSKRLRLSQTERSPRATHRAPLGKRPITWLGAVFFMPLLLAGCVDRAVSGGLSAQQQEAIPDTKVIDYRTAACDTLWQLDDKDALDNALYWLRAMDCADRIGSTQARALAKTVPGDSWSGVFKQSILLGSAQPTSGERRQMLDRINSYRMEFPGSLRPLTQLWRQQQMLQITLFDEKARYQHLQESSDSQIDSLRQNQARLQSQLQDTSRKLENLTDIERQLSSRKQLQGEIPENGAGSQKGEAAGKSGAAAKGAETQDEPEKGTALPVEPEDTYTPHPANKESHAQ
ncbi:MULTISPECIES: two-component system QseEF-associated lipoprotein QseG [Serratia]|nr:MULTISPECIES: two-component system QseEF-associated lipoprotein QseG [Serratia]MBH1926884.1 two-component system QseEF-associated lipoprotein QseG [Serratia ureilytica]MBH2542477.1 two-component system QseEF-associated lipoprotein QseG [Serratia ureilytica]MBH2648873.1 two-component system QseEF-associated lipoprotein QseG [Serratia ureilytica]CAF2714996.1 Quorum-sensing regulator protein G [Serratia marcescens]CAH5415871.1 Quorum-sensing regulator protein G [Serratia marcescens]